MHLGNLKLRDMKLSRSEKAEDAEIASDSPDYPYGLILNLDQDALEKLGIELPDVGDTFFVVAVATVRSVSEHKSDDHTSQDVSLQIEQLSLDAELVNSEKA
ncbi:hypothetical protein LCGC14_2805830 [marine sediment metagenome]|uniref:Uncharacterized protein n=1 Tax=marine sediment metagenome TaxID=412755 RepID=A0A0F9AUQ6_9ZZZZ